MTKAGLVHLTWDRVNFDAESEYAARARLDFDTCHLVVLPNLLAPEILKFVQDEVARETFYQRKETIVGLDFRITDARVVRVLTFLVNQPGVYRAVRTITGCEAVRGFHGRIACIPPRCGRGYRWHDDNVGERLVGMTINLNESAYTGGVLSIRERDSERILADSGALAPGDAVLFRIRRSLQHQVTAVEGETPRISFTGWYVGFSTLWPRHLLDIAGPGQ